jgi:YegS/Rv2252/BmrU family lipid kinase
MTTFLVNPASANGATGRRWQAIEGRAAEAGLRGTALFSERPGHLTELARMAAEEGEQLLVVVGGDGSVHEVANGIANLPEVEIAVIPRGTGGDFARSHGIPHRLGDALALARNGRARAVDLGRVAYRDGTSIFANVASAGMSGAIARRANETTKALGGKVSYLLATVSVFRSWQAGEVRVTVDGEERTGRMHDVIVALGPSIAGGMKLCPDADPADGQLDVLLLGDLAKRDLVLTMPKIYRGTHLPHPKAEALRGTTVTIEADAPVPVQLDGEQPGTTPARFEILPGALRVRVPD